MIETKFQKSHPANGAPRVILNKTAADQKTADNSVKDKILPVEFKEKMDWKGLSLLARQIISKAKNNKSEEIVICAEDFSKIMLPLDIGLNRLAEIIAVNFEMANFEFDRYKTQKKFGVKKITFFGESALNLDFLSGYSKGRIIGRWINYARSLANEPGSVLTPERLALEAKSAAEKVGLKFVAKTDLAKFGGVMAVGKGSVNTPRFIILEHNGADKKEQPIILIGKGVTYDSGGMDIKTNMLDMNMDMSGGAAVIAALAIAAKLKLKKNIVGLIPAVENMPSDKSYRPNDIIKMLSGKTVEVENTDAEGRIILADALTYATENYNPRLIVDIATLTGAAMYVAGDKYSVYLTNAKKLEDIAKVIGEKSGDLMWPLPLCKDYEKELEGRFADLSNIGKSKCGTITAALFLYQFVKEAKVPWLHIDMAPAMLASSGDYLAKGSAGAPIRFLVKLLEKEILPLLEVE